MRKPIHFVLLAIWTVLVIVSGITVSGPSMIRDGTPIYIMVISFLIVGGLPWAIYLWRTRAPNSPPAGSGNPPPAPRRGNPPPVPPAPRNPTPPAGPEVRSYSFGGLGNVKRMAQGKAPHLMPISFNPSAPLPVVTGSPIILHNGEQCRYFGQAVSVKVRQGVIGRTGTSAGASVRVSRNVTVHGGGSASTNVRGHIAEYNPGEIFVTDKRFIFKSAIEQSFEKRLSNLTIMNGDGGGLQIQFGSTQLNFLTPHGRYLDQLIRAIIQ